MARPTGELAVTLDQIKQFRQLHSRCPGHPEHGETSGVETTTGPLGQGVGNSVGMAIAQRWLAAQLQPARLRPVRLQRLRLVQRRRHDGGRQRRGGLAGRPFEALEPVLDVRRQSHHDRGQHVAGLQRGRGGAVRGLWLARRATWPMRTIWRRWKRPSLRFRRTAIAPTLIIVRSHIAWGAPHKQDTHEAHGAPLGEDEVRLTKQAYGWPPDAKFLVPDEVRAHFAAGVGARGRKLREAVARAASPDYQQKFPDLARELELIRTAANCRPAGTESNSHFRGRRQGPGHAGLLWQSAQRRGRTDPLGARRLGRPGALDHDAAQVRRGWPRSRPAATRPQLALWHPRARHGGRGSTAWRLVGLRPFVATFSSSATTCGRRCDCRPS